MATRRKAARRRSRPWAWLAAACALAVALAAAGVLLPLPLSGSTATFSIKHGSSLRSAARQVEDALVLPLAWPLEALARVTGKASVIQAGNYELARGISLLGLLQRITSGDRTQDQITLVEGWTFAQVRAALERHAAVRQDLRGLGDAEVAARLELGQALPEGLFFPDTYFFPNGTSDLAILRRAHRALQAQLDALWPQRAPNLPLADPYQALILASIVEKETGAPADRAMIAGVFVNRLRRGMLLQTDPTVIYGLGPAFDGNLRRSDLTTDGPYNTYLRPGLPPTPIAIAGLASLQAALQPATTDALYFVARGDGTSEFSRTLADHERAVTKYQRLPARSR
jgi:UPF0755 protein